MPDCKPNVNGTKTFPLAQPSGLKLHPLEIPAAAHNMKEVPLIRAPLTRVAGARVMSDRDQSHAGMRW